MSEISSTRSLGHKLEASIVPLAALFAAIVLWFLAAFCAGRFLIVFPPAQEVFISTLATLGWSGTTIYFIVGLFLAFTSLIQMLGWPRLAPQRLLQARLGKAVANIFVVLWLVFSFLEGVALAFGFERLAAGTYIALLSVVGLSPVSLGMIVLSILVAAVLALAPEWLLLRSATKLRATWQTL